MGGTSEDSLSWSLLEVCLGGWKTNAKLDEIATSIEQKHTSPKKKKKVTWNQNSLIHAWEIMQVNAPYAPLYVKISE